MSVKGMSEHFVRSFYLYYSDDGVIWTPYKEGSKIKVNWSEAEDEARGVK